MNGLLQPQIIENTFENPDMKIIQYPSDMSKSQSHYQSQAPEISNVQDTINQSDSDINTLVSKMNTLNAICESNGAL